MKPIQLDGLPQPALLPPEPHGPSGQADHRNWRQPSTLEPLPHRGALQAGDLVAIRWHDGWKLARTWRRERGGILAVLAVLEQGGSVWVENVGALMILHQEGK